MLDPANATVGAAVTLPLPLGHVSVAVVSRDARQCVFDYTEEVEGGYSIYRCRVPIAGPSVWIRTDSSASSSGFARQALSVHTSFDVEKGDCIGGGNLLNGQ